MPLDFLNSKDEDDNTVMHLAAKNGAMHLLALLMKHDVNINRRNEFDRTPLMMAAMRGHKAIIRILCKKSDNLVTDEDQDGRTALHLAALTGNIGCLKQLIKYGSDIAARDNFDMTPLDLAAQKGHLEVCKCFDRRRGRD